MYLAHELFTKRKKEIPFEECHVPTYCFLVEENITDKERRRRKKRNTFFVVRPFEGPKTVCGEISGDDRPGDSSHEGATMAFFG